jgi:hypothetical protein
MTHKVYLHFLLVYTYLVIHGIPHTIWQKKAKAKVICKLLHGIYAEKRSRFEAKDLQVKMLRFD